MASNTDDEDLFAQFQPDRRVSPEPTQKDTTGTQGLGIDEEIKIKKARKPVPKLDENRLLSQAGLPKLRKITKNRLKLKGKGHEFTDIVRLLNLYQVWLDDLYPRAKFRDALGMIEKLGHKKRMIIMRKQWLRNLEETDETRLGETQESAATDAMASADEAVANSEERSPEAPTQELAGESETVLDDELDALMNERVDEQSIPRPIPDSRQQRDQFADEEEAMAELDDWLL